MPKVTFPQKNPADTLPLVFDFSSYLPTSVTVSSAVTSATVYSGTDASPTALISGSPTVSSPTVTQNTIGGVEGVTYIVSCSATLSNAAIITLQGYLSVLSSYN